MFPLRVFILTGYFCLRVNSDWVKISGSVPDKREQISFKSDLLSDFLQQDTRLTNLKRFNPSEEWQKYQNQRFGGEVIKNVQVDDFKNNLKSEAAALNSSLTKSDSSKSSNFVSRQIDSTKKSNRIITASNVIKLDNVYDPEMAADETLQSIKNIIKDDSQNGPSEEVISESSEENHDPKSTENAEESKKTGSLGSIIQSSAFQRFINLIKSIQLTLFNKPLFTFQDKINQLKQLRDQFLINIEDKWALLWPQNKKTRRSAGYEAALEFPTTETALMTISFLTFAVFLIKLVLQVIHTIKSKHYNINSMTNMMMDDSAEFTRARNAQTFGSSPGDLEIMNNILKAVQNAAIKYN